MAAAAILVLLATSFDELATFASLFFFFVTVSHQVTRASEDVERHHCEPLNTQNAPTSTSFSLEQARDEEEPMGTTSPLALSTRGIAFRRLIIAVL